MYHGLLAVDADVAATLAAHRVGVAYAFGDLTAGHLKAAHQEEVAAVAVGVAAKQLSTAHLQKTLHIYIAAVDNRFLLFYFVCGIGAGLAQELVQYIQYLTTLQGYDNVRIAANHIIPMSEYLNMLTTVGASGAVYGILLAFGMMFPNSTIYIYFAIPLKAKWFVLIYGVIELFAGFTSVDNVAHFAHVGGMLFGLILILYWKKKGTLY